MADAALKSGSDETAGARAAVFVDRDNSLIHDPGYLRDPAQVRLLHKPIAEAADNTLAEIAAIGGDGGLIVLDAKGDYAMRFNTSGMYRGVIGNDGIARVGIFLEAETPVTCSPASAL